MLHAASAVYAAAFRIIWAIKSQLSRLLRSHATAPALWIYDDAQLIVIDYVPSPLLLTNDSALHNTLRC